DHALETRMLQREALEPFLQAGSRQLVDLEHDAAEEQRERRRSGTSRIVELGLVAHAGAHDLHQRVDRASDEPPRPARQERYSETRGLEPVSAEQFLRTTRTSSRVEAHLVAEAGES